MSYEQFGAFLANVKELNAHKQTKEVFDSPSVLCTCVLLLLFHTSCSDCSSSICIPGTFQVTLQKADEIFGPDNKDLYAIFEGLISRNVH